MSDQIYSDTVPPIILEVAFVSNISKLNTTKKKLNRRKYAVIEE
jgi:hypothetical protein